MKENLKGCTIEQLKEIMVEHSLKSYRGVQIAQWIYSKNCNDFKQMTNLSSSLRFFLDENFRISNISYYEVFPSKDNSKKYLFHLDDGLNVEGVSMDFGDKQTFCLSTQVGCPLKCAFCVTGLNGFHRNLTTAEIVDQFLLMKKNDSSDKKKNNIVLMGMGEPLLNYEAVNNFLLIATNDNGLGLSGRRITLSTAGIIPELYSFSKDWYNIQLAVSINAPNQALREKLMPVSKKYPLSELIKSLRNFPLPKRRRITFEYVLIENINDGEEEAMQLLELLKPFRCKINLIPYNETEEFPWKRPSESKIEHFGDIIRHHGMPVMIRRSRGSDIAAACGLLGKTRYELKT